MNISPKATVIKILIENLRASVTEIVDPTTKPEKPVLRKVTH